MNAPAMEALKYLDMVLDREDQEYQKEQQRYWMNFLTSIFSQPLSADAPFEYRQARERFISMIEPPEAKQDKKVYEWNIPEEEIQQARLYLVQREEGG